MPIPHGSYLWVAFLSPETNLRNSWGNQKRMRSNSSNPQPKPLKKSQGKKKSQDLPSLKLTVHPWKWMVERLCSFPFWGQVRPIFRGFALSFRACMTTKFPRTYIFIQRLFFMVNNMVFRVGPNTFIEFSHGFVGEGTIGSDEKFPTKPRFAQLDQSASVIFTEPRWFPKPNRVPTTGCPMSVQQLGFG